MASIDAKEKVLRDEIISKDFLKYNMFVEAGAGAGKTYIIVQRVLTQLKNGYKPGEIVVITFTKKAAGELLERIIKELRAAQGDANNTAEESENLKEALNHIDDMTISTIHSFCFKLLKEHSFEANLPVGVTLLTDDEKNVLQEKIFEEYLETLTRNDWDSLDALSPHTGRWKIKNEMEGLFRDFCALQKDIPIECPRKIKKKDVLEKENQAFLDEFLNLLNECIKSVNPKYNSWEELYADLGSEDCFAGKVLVGTEKVPGVFLRLTDPNYDVLYVLNQLHNNAIETKGFLTNPSHEYVNLEKSHIAEVGQRMEDIFVSQGSDANAMKQALLSGMNDILIDRKLKDFTELLSLEPYEDCLSKDAKKTIELLSKSSLSADEDKKLKDRIKKFSKDSKIFNSKVEKKCGRYSDDVISEAEEKLVEWSGKNAAFMQENAYLENEEYYQLCVNYAKKARDYYEEHRPAGLLDNDDLLNFTYDCLSEDSGLTERVAKRYRCFYVDEFQDTDNIQESFIRKLASKFDASDELRDGALFLVGDPKQSIYRFRGAEPEVFFRVKSNMQKMKNAKIYDLYTNFRSNEKIIGWVNDAYERLEKEAVDPGITRPLLSDDNASYQGMKNVRELTTENIFRKSSGGKVIAGVYHVNAGDGYALNDKGKTESKAIKDTTKEEDAKKLARLIRNLCDGGYTITRYKKDQSPYTDKIQYSDFLILTAAKTRMSIYLKAFNEYHIPVRFDGETDPSGYAELQAYVRIYQCLSNMKDPFYRAGAIEALGECGFWPSETERWKKGRMLLNALSKETYKMSGYGMAYALLEKYATYADKTKKSISSEREAILAKLQQMVETVLGSCSGTKRELADAFADYLSSSVEHELSLSSNPNAVRFMNVHKSKGLEGNIVVLTDRGKKGSNGKFSGGVIAGVYYPAVINSFRNKVWSAVDGMSKDTEYEYESDCEFHRLEYVAATRAEQALIFMDNVGTPGSLFAEKSFCYGIDELEDNTVAQLTDAEPPKKTPIEKDYDYDKEKRENLGTEEMKKKLEERAKPSDFESYRSAEEDATVSCNEYALIRPTGNVFGDMMHRSLELLMERFRLENRGDGVTLDDASLIRFCTLQAISEVLTDVPEDESDERSQLSKKTCMCFIEEILKSYLTELRNPDGILKGAKAVYTEMPFSYYDAHRDDREIPLWMNGSADLVIEKNNGDVLLLDYKSDSDESSNEEAFVKHLRDTYTPQLDEYKKALEKCLDVLPERIKPILITFSQRDESGKAYKDVKIRVRMTEII